MRLMIVNQFGPPDEAPTALLAGDIAARMESEGWETRIVASAAGYRERARGGMGRYLDELRALRKLEKQAFAAGKPDLLLAFSSPPFMASVAARLARRWEIPWVHWVLDLYPDVALTLGAAPRWTGWLLRRKMRRSFASARRVVAIDEDMRALLERVYGVEAAVCGPWLAGPSLQRLRADRPFPGWPGVPDDAPVWLYSGNLGRAHAPGLLLAVQRKLEESGSPWWLVAQGGGGGMDWLRGAARAEGVRRLVCAEYAAQEELASALARARARVVVQDPATAGMLSPSKLVLAAAVPGPLLWIGPPEGHTAARLRSRPATGVLDPANTDRIVAWLQRHEHHPVPAAKPDLGHLEELRAECLEKWSLFLNENG